MKTRIMICLLAFAGLLSGCGRTAQPKNGDMTVSSGSLNADGSWNAVITNTAGGQNRSAQLSWNAVNGAGCYAVYMIDTTPETGCTGR